jgi:hypothetical protein
MELGKKRKAPETDEEDKVEEPGDDGDNGDGDGGGGKRSKKREEDAIRCPLSSIFTATLKNSAGEYVEPITQTRLCNWSGVMDNFTAHWDVDHNQLSGVDTLNVKGTSKCTKLTLRDGPPDCVAFCPWRAQHGSVHFVGLVVFCGGVYFVPTIWHTGNPDAEYHVDVGFTSKTYMHHERVAAFPLRRVPVTGHIVGQSPVGDVVMLSKKLVDRHFSNPLLERGNSAVVYIRPHVAVDTSVPEALLKGFHFD